MEEELKPSWLDETFLKQVLESIEGSSHGQVSISSWRCNHAVPPGTNYLSLLYRLSVDYTIEKDSRSISLIVKTPLESGQVKESIEKVDGYGKEPKMYGKVLPMMYEIANDCKTVTARSYICPLHNSLVLEDLRELGYKMADRLKQLDAAHCRQFLKSLAKFHGLSIAVIHRDQEVIQSLGKNLCFGEDHSEEDEKVQEQFVKFNLTAMMKTVASMGFERYADIIREKIDTYYESLKRIHKPSGELRVLNHGDCWTTNALFKYDDSDTVIDAKLVDFQMCQVGSFAQDLIYFWWTSARQDVRENLQEELFQFYRQTLNQTLEDVQMTERVTKEEFDNEIKRFSPYALQVCSSVLTVAMADPDDLTDFNDMDKNEFEKPTEDSKMTKNFCSKYYKLILPDLLRQLEKFGAFTE